MIIFNKTFGEKERDVLVAISYQDKSFRKAQLKQQIVVVIGAAFLLALEFIGAGVLLLITGIFLIPLWNKKRLKNAYKRVDQRSVNGFRRYEISESGIDSTSEFGSGVTKWNAIASHGIYGSYIWMKRIDNTIILIDQTELSDEERLELMELMTRHIKME